MISSDPKSSPGLAWWAESYEAKCERRQEIRESRRRRRNETTCRQPGKVLRTQHREQLQRARQLQFLRRRNLEDETKGQVREQGPSCKTDGGTCQVTVLKESLPGANKTAFPGQQVGYVQENTALDRGGGESEKHKGRRSLTNDSCKPLPQPCNQVSISHQPLLFRVCAVSLMSFEMGNGGPTPGC